MASYKELQTQIAELQKKAEEARVQEIDGALTQIRELMKQYGITSEDILGKKVGIKNGPKSKSVAIQFRDGDKTWSGRGREPGWIKGKDKEAFRVK